MDRYELDTNPKVPRLPEAEKILLSVYQERRPELLLMAAMDTTRRRNLQFVLIYPNIPSFGGTVNYCKKTRRFDFIEYSSRGYAKRIDLLTPPAAKSAT